MNVFAAEHPLVSQPLKRSKRFRRWVFGCLLIYPVWLLLFGPFWAIDERGFLDFLPLGLRRIAYLPALPIFRSQTLFPLYESYLNLWYKDPDPPETTR